MDRIVTDIGELIKEYGYFPYEMAVHLLKIPSEN